MQVCSLGKALIRSIIVLKFVIIMASTITEYSRSIHYSLVYCVELYIVTLIFGAVVDQVKIESKISKFLAVV